MIRNLLVVAGASFVLAVACFTGVFALGGPDLVRNGWTIPADWDVRVTERDEIRVSRPRHAIERSLAWTGGDLLQVDLPADVSYEPGDEARVVISGPASIVDRIKLVDGRLFLTGADDEESLTIDGKGIRWMRDSDRTRIRVIAPAVRRFISNASGDLTISRFDQPELLVQVNGDGDVEAQGRADKITLEIVGSGDADLEDVNAGDAAVSIDGTGDASLSARGAVWAKIAGSGDITLLTKASKVISDVTGSGDVRIQD